MSNLYGRFHNDLTPSFLDQFVSSLYNCRNNAWQSIVKLDCSMVTSMSNVLGYPQSNWPFTRYPSMYKTMHSIRLRENCRTLIDHVYGGFLRMIHKSKEYVSSTDWSCFGSSTTPSPDDDYDGLSEWVIVVLAILGVIVLLGFFALLFFLIYKLYTHSTLSSETRYSADNRDQVAMSIPQNATYAPPTPPPAYSVRSNTRYVYRVITPSAVCPLNCRLCPLERYKRQCGDCTGGVGPEMLDSKGTGRCC